MFKITVILLAFFAFSQIFAQDFPAGIFKTPYDRYQFFNANSSSSFHGQFKFKVRASSNASIALSTRPNTTNLEFLIGVSNNMETRIRINNTDVVIMKTPQILSKNDFETFEITWSENIFHFAQLDESQNDTKNLMLYKNKEIFPINYIGLKTEGAWLVREKESPRIFDAYIKAMNQTVLQIGNSLRCMVIQTKPESKPIYVHTASSPIEHKNYTYVEVPQQNCYNIFVRAKYDAHISLSHKSMNNGIQPIVEFHLRPQGSYNYTIDYLSNQMISKFVPDLLNDQEYRGFWIEFNNTNNALAFGKIGESAMSIINIKYFSIDDIGVLTSGGNVGDWIIKKYGSCPGNKDDDMNEDGFWGDAKTRCYVENPNLMSE